MLLFKLDLEAVHISTFYPGIIAGVEVGTYTINYDDDEIESGVEPNLIAKLSQLRIGSQILDRADRDPRFMTGANNYRYQDRC